MQLEDSTSDDSESSSENDPPYQVTLPAEHGTPAAEMPIEDSLVIFDPELPEYGQSNRDWLISTNALSSGGLYRSRVLHFLRFHHKEGGVDMIEDLKSYLVHHKEETETNSATGVILPKYSPKTLNSWYSMIKKWWKYCGRGNLDMQAPLIGKSLNFVTIVAFTTHNIFIVRR